ncbi:MAG: hypothetical protein BWY87_00552 [Deltaproteobacteria bacterium ADurb.Bin510]|nr:MAG: hypothetical protein BWY87_00552 [Deltaproteobacteria bacterium ADurb.Bin510]
MMKLRTIRAAVLLGLSLGLSACASLPTPEPASFPFRAEFKARFLTADEPTACDGAVLLEAATRGLVQAYAPMGLATGTARIADGRLSLEDVWGQPVFAMDLPLADLPGLLAGELPRHGLLTRRRADQGWVLRYVWGRIWLDHAERPVRIVVGRDADITLEPSGAHLRVRGQLTSQAFELELEVLEGGRWR